MTDTVESQSRTWDVLCHLSPLVASPLFALMGMPFGHILGPLIVWLIKRGDSPSVDRHGKEALNFQISLTLYVLVATCVTVGLVFLIIGIFMLPLLIMMLLSLPVIELIFIIIAAVKAGDGEEYRYPLTLRLIS